MGWRRSASDRSRWGPFTVDESDCLEEHVSMGCSGMMGLIGKADTDQF